MSIETKDIKLQDIDRNIELCIRQFSATETVAFLNKLLSILAKARSVSTENIGIVRQAINNVMQTGVKIEGVSEVKMQLIGDEVLPIFTEVVKSAIAESSDDDQLQLMEKLLNAASIRAGTEYVDCSLRTIDKYLKNGLNIYKICAEVVKFNFAFLFQGSI